MPCYRCGVRQTDPPRGPSPWKRGVRAGEMVLVCPDCQKHHHWLADLDRCRTCRSTQLVRALGETTCLACRAVGDGAAEPDVPGQPDASVRSDETFSAEVGAALDRLLRGGSAQ